QFVPDRVPDAARQVQQEILAAYDRDFSKHAPLAEVPRLRALFASVPAQLARENRRFVYGQAQAGARAKTMELALQWLVDAGLVHKVPRVSAARLPLAGYHDGAFKLFLVDTGLVGAMAGLDARTLLEGHTLFTEFKGALAEQHALGELVAAGLSPSYWARTGGAEVDFVVQHTGMVVPVEVKAEVRLQAKSLRVFRDTYNPTMCVRTSLRPWRDEGWLVNLPLYALSALPGIIAARSARVDTEQL
ncbi:MAG: DUF4143 domain-containing protein, partial [Micrococcales bacterium]|nr:DUF4143 domain-containing protein [Micrococcales bacterium]